MARITPKETQKSVVHNLRLKQNCTKEKQGKESIQIGNTNLKKWDKLKCLFSMDCDVKFASFLLNLAKRELRRQKLRVTVNTVSIKRKAMTKFRKSNRKLNVPLLSEAAKEDNTLQCSNSFEKSNTKSLLSYALEEESSKHSSPKVLEKCDISNSELLVKSEALQEKQNNVNTQLSDKKLFKFFKTSRAQNGVDKKDLYFISNSTKENNFGLNKKNVKIANRIKSNEILTKHEENSDVIYDSIQFSDWVDSYKNNPNSLYSKESVSDQDSLDSTKLQSESERNKYSYAYLSLPNILYFKDTLELHGLGVFTSQDLPANVQFGPLIGKSIKEVDIFEDDDMRHIWEIHSETANTYVNSEDAENSNWVRFLRPAPTRNQKNLIAISKAKQLYFVTTHTIKANEELLFWQDETYGVKKRLEKTNCGGCNLKFSHPLYYRIHCSVFHDIRYSLTIRKYHCKVCGAAVLGKENITKHAVELHNGQGAYQCQFCKKFFMRLNYLEMHRTYGCSANPHRAQPLCDFCGRKFCQPQKLKVHIKRMHSDISEVLKEFQCKDCLRILGSRAALQRHVKEVHQKDVGGACACSKCGKLFQNKSNLKIHMLTHSGVKPFKCSQENCLAAFTTKQCLQFHYKKAHGFADDSIPKIERCIEYTFAAYSGGNNEEEEEEELQPVESTQTKRKKREKKSEEEEQLEMQQKEDDNNHSIDQQAESVAEIAQTSKPKISYSVLDTFVTGSKLMSKGSKKWLGENQPQEVASTLQKDVYNFEEEPLSKSAVTTSTLENDTNTATAETSAFTRSKFSNGLNSLNVYSTRHESSNASMLVEAALDSVSDMQISNSDVASSDNAIVDSLYLHQADMNYTQSASDAPDMISACVAASSKDNVEDIQSNFTLAADDFSSQNNRSHLIQDYIQNSTPSTPKNTRSEYNLSAEGEILSQASSPRYNFTPPVHVETLSVCSDDESDTTVAQNLSLNNPKTGRGGPSALELGYGGMEAAFKKYDLDKLKMFDSSASQTTAEALELNPPTTRIENDETSKFRQFDIESLTIRNKYTEEVTRKYDPLDVKYERSGVALENDLRNKAYDLIDSLDIRGKSYDLMDIDFSRSDRNFEPIVLNTTELQGLDMTARNYHSFHSAGAVTNLNRYHHLYGELDRPNVDLRLSYSPPPPTYSHPDMLRVVSLDLTPPGRHSVDLSLRGHPLHQLPGTRLLDHALLPSDHNRLSLEQTRIEHNLNITTTNRILSDHTTNRLLSNDDNRIIDQNRLLAETRILQQPVTGTEMAPRGLSPNGYSNYPVSPSYVSTMRSPNHTPNTTFHHYPTYY